MKELHFKLNTFIIQLASKPIRTKFDLINLLVHTIKFIITTPPVPTSEQQLIPHNEKLIIYINKMSRIIFCIDEKIFSFQFPFTLKEDSDSYSKLSISYNGILIDNLTSSILISLFGEESIFNGTFNSLNEKISSEILENNWPEFDDYLFCELVKILMLFEPGYLRYDHDIQNSNPPMHPEHHIDFYFSSFNTMKIGLSNSIIERELIDILNTSTACKYLI